MSRYFVFGCSTSWKMALLAGVACLLTAGCGGSEIPPSNVSGKVTFNGAPLAEGSISFGSDEGDGLQAQIGPDGTYTGTGVKPGTYKVMIVPPPPPTQPHDATGPPPEAPEYPNIPQKYRDFQTSGLTTELKEGNNMFDVEMTE